MPASELRTRLPIILIGAFDRHNFGDLLFPHVVAALLKKHNLLYGGLVQRDLRGYGGHRVNSLPRLAQQFAEKPVHLLHAGGELLTCSTWEAAVMMLPPDPARETIARLSAYPCERQEWASRHLGIADLAPYIASRSLFPCAANVVYNAVGGVDFATLPAPMQAELLEKLSQASEVAIRDRRTQTALRAAGVESMLMPDSAVMIAELFADKIHDSAKTGETAKIRSLYPQGYIAMQFSADFGDDTTLARLARQLDEFMERHPFGIVLFRAGAAPWHDDLNCYRRLALQMRNHPPSLFYSLNVWDICALIAYSQAYCGSSLHGRIVAAAFARPRINIRHPGQQGIPTKQEAFVNTWEQPGMPGVFDIERITEALCTALTWQPQQLRQKAVELAGQYIDGFRVLKEKLVG